MSHQGQWQVQGSAPENYDRALVPAVFAPWAPRVLALADPKVGDRVLDVACGTGVVAHLAAERVGATGTVAALDLNPGMLAVARAKAPRAGTVSAPVTWWEASATAMPFPDTSFDIVYCQLGLQFFPDRPAALREMYRVLAPLGRLGLMVWRGIERSPGFRVLAEGLDKHVGAEAAAMMRAPFSLSEANELHGLIAGAGFRDITVQSAAGMVRFPSPERLVQDYGAGSPLAGFLAKATDQARTALVWQVTEALQSYCADGSLSFPIEANLASARKLL